MSEPEQHTAPRTRRPSCAKGHAWTPPGRLQQHCPHCGATCARDANGMIVDYTDLAHLTSHGTGQW